VNADDFGLTAGVNKAILELGEQHALTSATLMAIADATAEAVSSAHQPVSFGIGCHVVLVDGSPVLPARELPTLVDPRTGRFRSTLGVFARDLFLGRIHPEEIEAEAEAQIGRLRSWGLSLTHIDTHKHTHMFPRVLAPLIKAAKRQNIRAIRNPFEPEWSLAATIGAPFTRRLQVQLLNRFRPAFLRFVAQSGLATTDGSIGVLATGTLDAATLASLLRAMPEGTWELVTHPGYNDSALAKVKTRLLASRELERQTFSSVSFQPDIKLIGFSDLAFSEHLSS